MPSQAPAASLVGVLADDVMMHQPKVLFVGDPYQLQQVKGYRYLSDGGFPVDRSSSAGVGVWDHSATDGREGGH